MKCKKFPAFEVSGSYREAAQNFEQGGAFEFVENEEAVLLSQFSSAGVRSSVHPIAHPTKTAPAISDVKASDSDEEVPSSKSFEERLNAIISCIGSQNSLREILYKTLSRCIDDVRFEDLEAFIKEQDEFIHSHVMQTPFTLIKMLIDCGGVYKIAIGPDGQVVEEDALHAMDEDERYEAIDTYLIKATDAGMKAKALLDPMHRLEAQLAQKPHREGTYLAVIDFCKQPKTFPEIQEFFKDTPDLAIDEVTAHHKLSPDFYVDKLEKAGALVWKGKWVATEAGRQMLAARS